MPLCTLHLLALARNNDDTSTSETTATTTDPLPHFLATLRDAYAATETKPLTVARPLRWIITPTALSRDLPAAHQWDVLLILPAASPALPEPLDALVAARWAVTFGVPGRVLEGYEGRNGGLLAPKEGDVPALEEGGGQGRLASSAQGLELSGELLDWVRETFGGRPGGGGGGGGGGGAVSMLNLLAFRDGMKGEYLKYGKAFAEDVGRKRGAVAKIVGTVVEDGGGRGVGGEGAGEGKGERVWDEVALAHYPSIWHFADMLASEDYQAVNRRHRVGSLKDTFILCTTELGLPWDGGKEGRAAAKL